MGYLPHHGAIIPLVLFFAGWASSGLAQEDQRQAAISLEQKGETAAAEKAWTALSKRYPSNPEPLAHLGLLEARQEHYAEAIRYYRRGLALSPTMPGLQLNLGLAQFKNGDFKEAIATFSPLVKAEPGDQRLTILIGMSHYGLREYAAATPYLQAGAKQDAHNLTLLLTLAHSCLYSKQFQCVLDTFHQIVALNADSAEADMLVGEALDEMNDTLGAMREFRAAAAMNPKEPNVHFGLGYLLWTERHYEEATSEFQAELDNDPHQLQAMAYLANSYIQLNRMDDARPLLEKFVKLSPDDSMGHLDLGIVYAEEGRNNEALAELQTAARIKPSDVTVHIRLARIYRSLGKNAEAKVEFDKSKNLNKQENERLLKMMSEAPGVDHRSLDARQLPKDR